MGEEQSSNNGALGSSSQPSLHILREIQRFGFRRPGMAWTRDTILRRHDSLRADVVSDDGRANKRKDRNLFGIGASDIGVTDLLEMKKEA